MNMKQRRREICVRLQLADTSILVREACETVAGCFFFVFLVEKNALIWQKGLRELKIVMQENKFFTKHNMNETRDSEELV